MAEKIGLGHGGGGTLSRALVGEILRALPDPLLERLGDSAELEAPGGRLAFTTDSFTVKPMFFPGGDIGSLAVCGTVNDLSAAGARPRWLSLSFIIEEGLEMELFRRVLSSLAGTARRAGARIVTGDTKVVDRGACDGLFINTAGIGELHEGAPSGPGSVRPGDAVLLSGLLAEHGTAVINEREGFGAAGLRSDCAPLWGLVEALLDSGAAVRFMRDPTRGGLASALNELAQGREFGVSVSESEAAVSEPARAFCEMLGYDPLYVANEGKMVVVTAPEDAEKALRAMRGHPLGKDAVRVGEITAGHPGKVFLSTAVGGRRVLDMLAGGQFPRIC